MKVFGLIKLWWDKLELLFNLKLLGVIFNLVKIIFIFFKFFVKVWLLDFFLGINLFLIFSWCNKVFV